jgi:hypothetical protein
MHAHHRKKKNFIRKIVARERICTSHEEKAAAIDDFYQNLVGTYTDRGHTINLSELGIPTQLI